MSKRLHNYFDKIYVINLFDMEERWKKVSKQFKTRKIKIERFVAIDGRCKNQGKEGCLAKAKSFELSYGVDILGNKNNLPLKELLPASSLTIGTVLLLRNMVKKKYKRILVCEDDIVLGKNFEKNFFKGVKELGKKRWDILYLGCGHKCGQEDISTEQSRKIKHESQLIQFYGGEKWYVKNKDDLRGICDDCPKISPSISKPEYPGGTWCYSYSLSGAKKVLKLLDNKVYNHIDRILAKYIEKGRLSAIAFDPPIVMHEYGAMRSDSQIPWEW